MNQSEGEEAVRLARAAIEVSVGSKPPADPAEPHRTRPLPAMFEEPRGVFVTLERHPSRLLRGCVGFSQPVYALRLAIPRAAAAAATEDPRFPPVRSGELTALTVEVSVLTVPELLENSRPAELPNQVVVGRDGVIVDGFGMSGLLLPQVAPEQGWNSEQLLAETSMKAGLPPDAWLDKRTQVRRFRAEIFRETVPGGPVIEAEIEPELRRSSSARDSLDAGAQ